MFKPLAVVGLIVLGLASASRTEEKSANSRTELPKPDADGFITIFNLPLRTGAPGTATRPGRCRSADTRPRSRP